jgi:hypothetical protein
MKRMIAAVAVSATILVASLVSTAGADTVGRLTRRVNRLENRVTNLQRNFNGFVGFFFTCITFDLPTASITGNDGQPTTGWTLYLDDRCLSSAQPESLEKVYGGFRGLR